MSEGIFLKTSMMDQMKRNNLWMLAAILTCGLMVTSCSNNDEPSVTVIENSAFDFCAALTSVTIPDKVEDISKFAFGNCLALKTVTLGKGVKNLYEKCFEGCNALTDVYCQAEDAPLASQTSFEGDLLVKTLHVPEGSLAKYQNTEPWNQFGSIVALTDEETAIKSIDRDA